MQRVPVLVGVDQPPTAGAADAVPELAHEVAQTPHFAKLHRRHRRLATRILPVLENLLRVAAPSVPECSVPVLSLLTTGCDECDSEWLDERERVVLAA